MAGGAVLVVEGIAVRKGLFGRFVGRRFWNREAAFRRRRQCGLAVQLEGEQGATPRMGERAAHHRGNVLLAIRRIRHDGRRERALAIELPEALAVVHVVGG